LDKTPIEFFSEYNFAESRFTDRDKDPPRARLDVPRLSTRSGARPSRLG